MFLSCMFSLKRVKNKIFLIMLYFYYVRACDPFIKCPVPIVIHISSGFYDILSFCHVFYSPYIIIWYYCISILRELPHAKAVKLPDSLTELALTYGILLKYLRNNKVEDSISTGVNSVRTIPTRFNPSFSMFMLEL